MQKNNDDYSGYVTKLYDNYFFPKYKNKSYIVRNKFFSNEDILDCLEKELKSFFRILEYIRLNVFPEDCKKILVLGGGSGKFATTLKRVTPNL